MSEPRHLDHLDALRGYAILAVIATHVAQFVPTLPHALLELFGSGQFGVHLFFVVSAVTLMQSWAERRDGAGPFYTRRFFRLAPMWLLFVAGWSLFRGLGPTPWAPDGLTIWDVLSAVIFVHVWVPNAINSVVPGGWSIGAEACFYAMFPLLAAILTTRLRAAAFALLTIFLCILAEDLVWPLLVATAPSVRGNFLYFWFPNQLPTFAFGILAYQLIRRPMPRAMAEGLAAAALLAIALLPVATPLVGPVVYGVVFALLAVGMGQGGGRYLVNALIKWCGQRSYSAYFWHFVMLGSMSWLPAGNPQLRYLLSYAAVVVLTFMASDLTYRFVELPGIALGKRLLARRSATLRIDTPMSSEVTR